MAEERPLWAPLYRAPFFEALERRINQGSKGLCLTGLVEGARALVLSLLSSRTGKPLLLVLPDHNALAAYRRDLSAFAELLGRDPKRIMAFPALDADPYYRIAPHPEVARERILALNALARGAVDMLLAPARALQELLFAPRESSSWTRVIRKGDTLPPDKFVLQALGLGYSREDIVSAPGEISRRGGIIDIYPPTAEEPVRIELFGDAVESLRSFDTDHQRSTGQLFEAFVGPATENPPTESAAGRLAQFLEKGLGQVQGDDLAIKQFRELIDLLQTEGRWPGFESLTALTSDETALLFEHARELLLVVDEPELTAHELSTAAEDRRRSYEQSGARALPPPSRLFADPGALAEKLAEADLFLQELAGEEPAGCGTVWSVPCRSSRSYSGLVGKFIEDLRSEGTEKKRTVCLMRAPGGAGRLMEIFKEYRLEAVDCQDVQYGASDPWIPGGLFVGVGGLGNGFELPGLGLSVHTERDLFGKERKPAARKTSKHAAFISDFKDLEQGALVVHVDHGIARYAGLGRPKGGSLNRDFMLLEFAGGDRLFVPVDRLDLVQRYSGVAGRRPVLDRLGGPAWPKVKSKVRKSVESMAKELLDLYASREAASGIAFSPDGSWQRELEAAFPYDLTADQVRAMAEIKEDMESRRTMDRLLVGDVGYGKTEIAVRAAFKAVMDGYQVALLTPTTVLAVQHFETFLGRFAPFPVRVEMVSRFRSPADIKQSLQDLETGAVDVLIGTHRLLSKDVRFRRLGLLVVDEEQRFGVAHKEKLKKMAIGMDVLSMTATPLPRTLQLSMAGVRDLSVIETPPPGRIAIQTYVTSFRTNVLARAMRQELQRGGQVFVVHNKIETLPSISRAISEMLPEARVVAIHGKLPERQIESAMLRFTRHEADILVTTTIIENGLDIPRANTMIVNRADRFGLAQLYQLRGRVGRSHQHAYAYLIVPARRRLSAVARKRLRAVQEFSELGAGFRLAAADLEIRGAGELLGRKQHGHIAALGFDLYCQLLEQAVRELKGEPVIERLPVGLHLGVDIKIPENYLPQSEDRLAVYKRLAQAATLSDVDMLQAETEDLYGHLPRAARNLFDIGRLRLVAEEAGVKTIDLVEDRLQIRFHEQSSVEPSRVLELIARERGSLTPSGMLALPAPPRGADRLKAVSNVLERVLGISQT